MSLRQTKKQKLPSTTEKTRQQPLMSNLNGGEFSSFFYSIFCRTISTDLVRHQTQTDLTGADVRPEYFKRCPVSMKLPFTEWINIVFLFLSFLRSFLFSLFCRTENNCNCPPYHCICQTIKVESNSMQSSSSYANTDYFTGTAATPNHSHHHQHHFQSSHHHNQPHHSSSSTGSVMSTTASTNIQYWPSVTQQHSPNDVTNFGNAGTYHHTNGEPVYTMHQQTPHAASHIYVNSGSQQTNYGTINETQDIYQYSPYSGDMLPPDEMYQLDQPIRSANVSSLITGTTSTASSSPPATLLDLGSGTIEQKPIIYTHHDIAESTYYNNNNNNNHIHDDNSTHSSHNNDTTNCYYQNVNESIHLNNNNNNNNNPSMLSMNAHNNNVDATNGFVSNNYYCDTRRYTKPSHAYAADAHSPTQHSPTEQHQLCLEFPNASVMSYSVANNNNNNNSSNNNNNNFKGTKRKASDSIAFADGQQQYTYHQTHLHSTEYYGSDEHIAATNLDLHQANDNGSEYCIGPQQYGVYFSGSGNENANDLAHLTTNYPIPVVNQ